MGWANRFNWPGYLELRDEKHEQDLCGENREGITNKTVYMEINSSDIDFGDVNYANCPCSISLICPQNNVSCWSLLMMFLNIRFYDSKEFVKQINMS